MNQASASSNSCWFDTVGGCDSGGWFQCTEGACGGDMVIIKPKN
jgi:hypothetical protein